MAEEIKNIFTEIYHKKAWGNGESVSGSGSSLEETKRLREALPEIIKNLNIKSILDIPCGDFNWMRHVDLTGIQYIGADIVPELIDEIYYLTADFNDVSFKILDVTKDKLPQVDLVICRDCLVHLSYQDAMNALANICASNSKYLLTTTFTLHHNEDIETGGWRPLNLMDDPFNFPKPLLVLNEGNPHPYYCDKAIALWRIEN